MARTADACSRYEDMAEYMKRVVEHFVQPSDPSTVLNFDERTLLASAFKNAISKPRLASKIVKAKLDEKPWTPDVAAEIQAYNATIEGKVRTLALEIFGLLTDKLIPAVDTACSLAPSAENLGNKVFYHKMEGDYYRYLAEICQLDEMEAVKQNALRAYTAGQQAGQNLPPNDDTVLSLALNLAVFYHEVCKDQQQAVQVTTSAIRSVQGVPQTEDVQKIVKLLEDNLSLWTAGSTQFDGTAVEDC